MTTRLVSFLGLGKYEPVSYEWNGRVSSPTRLVEQAIVELDGAVDEVVLLGTDEVYDTWIASGELEKWLHRSYDFRRVPKGSDPSQLRQIFETVVAAMGISWPGHDSGRMPQRILLDVTHGLRIQPILATSALSFALSEWKRVGVTPPEVQALYGAYEAAVGDAPRPIWDLTEIVTVANWNAAIDAMLRYGRADDIASLAQSAARAALAEARERGEDGKELGRWSHIRILGEAARRFADDLALGRVRDLLRTSAPDLRRKLGDEKTEHWTNELPLLRGAVAELVSVVEPLCLPDGRILGPEGLQAMAALARYYGRIQRFAEQAAAIRETTVGLAGHLAESATIPDPGEVGCLAGRKRAESVVDRLVSCITNDEGPGGTDARLWEIGKLAATVHPLRNDIEHLGLNDKPRPSKTLRRSLESLKDELADLVERLLGTDPSQADGVGATSTDMEPCFVNISNHPSGAWPAAQREAAEALAGRIVDSPFPEVPPDAQTEAIVDLAEAVARQVPPGCTHAMVMGELTLTLALVRKLKARGIGCVAATGPRNAEELPDG